LKRPLPQKVLSWLQNFELILFPSYCRLCSSYLESSQERIVCRNCWRDIKLEKSAFCLSCGRFFDGVAEPHLCSSCLQAKPPYSVHRSCGRYRGKLKDIVLLCKFHNLPILADGLARFMLDRFKKEEALWWEVEAIVPVPLHPKRERLRGYNHAQKIAKKFAELSGIEMLDKRLVKVKNVPPQMSLAMADRFKSVQGAFAVGKNEGIKGKALLLVDDVYTTGATVCECTRVLLEAGAGDVRVLTVAQA
jgi:competence protein ComFC